MASNTGSPLGFEATLWQAADKLRNNMDAAEYKHVVLGLIFLKYISDAFEERHRAARRPRPAREPTPRTATNTVADNIFWVPKEARWSYLKANAKQPTIGKLIDDAMAGHRAREPHAQGRPAQGLRPARARQATPGRADRPHRHHRPGRRGATAPRTSWAGSTSTSSASSPAPKARRAASSTRRAASSALLVEMLAPYKGRVYDPCCGSGGMFVQSEKFVEAARRPASATSPSTGRSPTHTTWRLAKMNLAIRGIEANLGAEHADSFHRDLHTDLKADFVLANPPFND